MGQVLKSDSKDCLKDYQTKSDADLPDVFLVEWRKRHGQSHRHRHHDSQVQTQKQGPMRRLHGREVDWEDEWEEQQVDEPELKSTRRS